MRFQAKGWFAAATARISEYLAGVPGSLQGHLNGEELARVSMAAMTTGTGISGALSALALQSGSFFPSPADAGLAVAVLTLILESRRRLGHGKEPFQTRVRNKAV